MRYSKAQSKTDFQQHSGEFVSAMYQYLQIIHC